MSDASVLAEFEGQRQRLAALAQRMLGSRSEADDALQEAWLRIFRADATDVDNLAGWFTTITARVCLNMLRARSTRRVDPFDNVRPDPFGTVEHGPEAESTLAEAVGAAMTVILETLAPAERLAFVLHDMFGVPFDEIAGILGHTPAATRQLASRARRRVQGREADGGGVRIHEHRRVVDAFFSAARLGRLDDLMVLLDPDVVLSNWAGPSSVEPTVVVHGTRQVAGRAVLFARPMAELWPVLVDGRVGVLVTVNDMRMSLMVFNVGDGAIGRIDALTDPHRLARLNVCIT